MTTRLNGHCPNCGGELVRRPVRPEEALRHHPPPCAAMHSRRDAGLPARLKFTPEESAEPEGVTGGRQRALSIIARRRFAVRASVSGFIFCMSVKRLSRPVGDRFHR